MKIVSYAAGRNEAIAHDDSRQKICALFDVFIWNSGATQAGSNAGFGIWADYFNLERKGRETKAFFVFWDVGANVGAYSLCAAKGVSHTTRAFEPLASNYHVLNRDVEENALGDLLTRC